MAQRNALRAPGLGTSADRRRIAPNSGLVLPERRFIVTLAPADERKGGASFDLAIAIALLTACGMCAANALPELLLIGELSLDGRLRAVRAVLAHLLSARDRGLALEVRPASTLRDVVGLNASEERHRRVPS